MSKRKRVDPSDVLHAAGLYTTPNGMIRRCVTMNISQHVLSAMIMSCVVDNRTMLLGLSLYQYQKKYIDGLLFEAAGKKWFLKLVGGKRIPIEYVEISAT